MRIERLPGGVARNRHHEVPPRVAHQPFHLPFVVALARTSELLREQVMALQLSERSCFHPRPIAQNPRYCQLGVVVQDRAWDSAEVRERMVVTFQECFRRLSRESHYEAV